jgi:hypothetical protein
MSSTISETLWSSSTAAADRSTRAGTGVVVVA